MIVETVSTGRLRQGYAYAAYRTQGDGSSSSYTYIGNGTTPTWVRVVRSGNTFTGYTSPDGVNWTQATSQTITMAQNVYMGLAVAGSTSTAYTTTFDNVAFTATSSPGPVISSVSATTGSVGGQVGISGSGFGTSQGSSAVLLQGSPLTVNSWNDGSITVTIPTGATTGDLVVSVAPAMDDSNPVYFTVTSTPLPSGWFDQDIGLVGIAGNAGYSTGAYTVQGGGSSPFAVTADAFHFVYTPMVGDGSITARVTNTNTSGHVGVMIRENLDAGSDHMFMDLYQSFPYEVYRSNGENSQSSYSYVGNGSITLPFWIRASRSGNSFSVYVSLDGVNWTQVGTTQTITMAQNTYMGLVVAGNTSTAYSATFDSLSTSSSGGGGSSPTITGVTPAAGNVGASVTISGSNFGSSQGSSTVSFNGTLASAVSGWNDNEITATIPSGAVSGSVSVVVNSVSSTCNGNCEVVIVNDAVTSLSPPEAPVGGTVTVGGTGFGSAQGTSQLELNGNVITPNSWSNSSISFVVPSGASSGPVNVVVSGVPSNSEQLTVLEPLTVTGITPAAAAAGSLVTISGTGFGSSQNNSTLSFYGGTANVTGWSDNQITATVSFSTASGPISVSVAGLNAEGPTFTLTSTSFTTDSLGNQSSYTSEMSAGQWLFTSGQGSGCSSCSSRGTLNSTYDGNGNVLAKTDELGNTTSYTYDSNNNVTAVSRQLDVNTTATTSYTYNSFGEVLTSTDALGNVTTNSYDTNGNLLSVTTPPPSSNTAASGHSLLMTTKANSPRSQIR